MRGEPDSIHTALQRRPQRTRPALTWHLGNSFRIPKAVPRATESVRAGGRPFGRRRLCWCMVGLLAGFLTGTTAKAVRAYSSPTDMRTWAKRRTNSKGGAGAGAGVGVGMSGIAAHCLERLPAAFCTPGDWISGTQHERRGGMRRRETVPHAPLYRLSSPAACGAASPPGAAFPPERTAVVPESTRRIQPAAGEKTGAWPWMDLHGVTCRRVDRAAQGKLEQASDPLTSRLHSR